MTQVEQLVYGYVRAMEHLRQTGDEGYRKTSGMFRERLRRQGFTVLDWTVTKQETVVRMNAGDRITSLHLPVPGAMG